MGDTSDSDTSPCKDGSSNQLSARKRRSTRRTFSRPASVGGETVIPFANQIRTSNPDSREQEKLDGHDEPSAKRANIKVKEERVSSDEEEDASYGEGEGNVSSGDEETSCKAGDTSEEKGLTDVFVQKNNIGRSKEISEDLRKQVVEAHKNGKGYKRIAKDLDLHQSTVRQIVYKWKKFSTVATLPRSGRPTKISAKARRTILKHMRENSRVTAKDLKASLALDNINVHESTIRKTLNKWCSWDFTMDDATALQQE